MFDEDDPVDNKMFPISLRNPTISSISASFRKRSKTTALLNCQRNCHLIFKK